MTHAQQVAPAPQLAEAHRYLIGAFVLNFFLSFLPNLVNVFAMVREEAPPFWYVTYAPLFAVTGIITSLLLVAALYVAAKRLGFRPLTIVLALVLSFFVGILGLVLLVSADIRITRHLKAQGWKVGLLGATKA